MREARVQAPHLKIEKMIYNPRWLCNMVGQASRRQGREAADLPVIQSSKFEFVINLNTARAFGLSFSPGLSADTISEHVSQREVTMQLSKAFALAFTVVSVLFVVLLLLSTGTLNARDADLASLTFAAAQTAKQQCINTCRARYRDCLSL